MPMKTSRSTRCPRSSVWPNKSRVSRSCQGGLFAPIRLPACSPSVIGRRERICQARAPRPVGSVTWGIMSSAQVIGPGSGKSAVIRVFRSRSRRLRSWPAVAVPRLGQQPPSREREPCSSLCRRSPRWLAITDRRRPPGASADRLWRIQRRGRAVGAPRAHKSPRAQHAPAQASRFPANALLLGARLPRLQAADAAVVEGSCSVESCPQSLGGRF